MSEVRPDEVLKSIADELAQLPDNEFFRVVKLLNLCTVKAKELSTQLEAEKLTSSVLRAKLLESEEHRDNLLAKLAAAEKERDLTKEALGDTTEQLGEAWGQNALLTAKLVKNEEKLLETETELDYCKSDYIEQSKRAGELEKEYDKLTTVNEALKKSLAEAVERAEVYSRQNQEQATTIAQMREALAQPIETAKKSWSANCHNGCGVSSCGRCFGCSAQALGYLIHSIEQVLSTHPTVYEQRVQGLVNALEWYADRSQYQPGFERPGESTMGGWSTDPLIFNDEGERAREALAALGGRESLKQFKTAK